MCDELIALTNRNEGKAKRAKRKAAQSQTDSTRLRDITIGLKKVVQEIDEDIGKEIGASKRTLRSFGEELRKAAADLDEYLDEE